MANKGKTIVCTSIVLAILAIVLVTGKVSALWALFLVMFIWEMN